ncbi:hypothetical protein Q8G40_29000, partial [Klebsiella pneumoniae]
ERTAVWEALASAGPVFQIPGGPWMLTSREAVRYAHRNPDLFSSKGFFQLHDLPIKIVPTEFDPPDHDRYRRILNPMLSPRVVNATEDE